jgi:hypothetical protein
MNREELCAWNTQKLAELGGDALLVASHVVATWPNARITSAARDYREQARAMAQNAVARRDNPKTPRDDRLAWIKDTYWPSIAAIALQQWFEQHPNASEPDVVAGFTHLMSGLQPAELRALSKHVVIRERDEGDGTGACTIDDRAHAVDFAPPRLDATPEEVKSDAEMCAYLHGKAEELGGKFLVKEGGITKRHWQAR